MKEKGNFSRFLLLWTGQLISAIGGGLTSFGLGVYVFTQTGSAASMALVTLLAFLPTLILSVPAGILADRYDRRLLMMLGDGLSALGIIYIFICIMMGDAKLYQICIGVFISSVFSSLLEPSYRASVTDLLSEKEYSKASGLVSIAGSARYLISPVIAGLLLIVSDISLLLLIDICTFFITVITTGVVKKGLQAKVLERKESFIQSFKGGWTAITEKKGIIILITVSSVMTCFIGALQILSQPLILDFTNSTVLGITETICACGMLISSVILSIRGIKKGFVRVLSLSLAFAGVSMIFFGLNDNIYLIAFAGFIFFATLPFANNCLDYLVRTNIASDKQGRAWGLIGLLSQIGYVVAYAVAGLFADGIANKLNVGVGRGAGIVICISGVMLAVVALVVFYIRDIRELEYHEQAKPPRA